MNKKHYITIFILTILIILLTLSLSNINLNPEISYKNNSYAGENEDWTVSLDVRDTFLKINITPKNLVLDKDSKIQCMFKTSRRYTSSGTLYYGNTRKSFMASLSLINYPINYKDEIVTVTYNNKEEQISLHPIIK
ncbi:hypothetical protein [Clostridium manihotivorum]|uniref:Uncharacterized protein n=1 Tax=Clostridium manihotivorum TaxID=2320868 RepID=A0A410DY70_9CLOT|nr:hypothetical protein [Clostridium manihotivorum]QAA33938.1 hypothetical protein C1I91_21165 [Clostridium manihotivorum]